MNAKKLHQICYEAYLECPQAREYYGDEEIQGWDGSAIFQRKEY